MEWKGELVKFLKGSILRGYLLLTSCLLFSAFFFLVNWMLVLVKTGDR